MVAVIGDIHGCYYTLIELFGKIKGKYPDADVYSVGDLVDRGNFSYEVVDFFITEKIKFTPGNHDYMFYFFIKYPVSDFGRTWLYNGYETTIASYDNRFEKVQAHLDFIKEQPLYLNLRDCFISHAGISRYYKSKVPKEYRENLNSLDELVKTEFYSEHGVLWTRDELLDLGKLQVVGHTRHPEVTHKKYNNSIYIDTSVYTGNKLSAIIIEESNILDTISEPTDSRDIE